MIAQQEKDVWRVSLHGGHSSEYCDHAFDPLESLLETAVQKRYQVFGVSEHIPRTEERFLYPNERERGWTVAKITDDFERYTPALTALAEKYEGRLTVLRGFEAEVIPSADYAARVRAIRGRLLEDGSPAFDYFVGSVHYVEEHSIDGELAEFEAAVQACGNLENLAVRYYQQVAEMIEQLRPDVVGHLDLIKKNPIRHGYDLTALQTPKVQKAINLALDAAEGCKVILDLNTAGWRKGLGEPYPSPNLVQQANTRGIPFCFGEDSHRIADVGAGIEEGRNYLLANGVKCITGIDRVGTVRKGKIIRKIRPLEG